MAGIDKIYGTVERYDELRAWLQKRAPSYLRHLAAKPLAPVEPFVIANFPSEADEWLWFHCPIQWVLDIIDNQHLISQKRRQYSANPPLSTGESK